VGKDDCTLQMLVRTKKGTNGSKKNSIRGGRRHAGYFIKKKIFSCRSRKSLNFGVRRDSHIPALWRGTDEGIFFTLRSEIRP